MPRHGPVRVTRAPCRRPRARPARSPVQVPNLTLEMPAAVTGPVLAQPSLLPPASREGREAQPRAEQEPCSCRRSPDPGWVAASPWGPPWSAAGGKRWARRSAHSPRDAGRPPRSAAPPARGSAGKPPVAGLTSPAWAGSRDSTPDSGGARRAGTRRAIPGLAPGPCPESGEGSSGRGAGPRSARPPGAAPTPDLLAQRRAGRDPGDGAPRARNSAPTQGGPGGDRGPEGRAGARARGTHCSRR